MNIMVIIMMIVISSIIMTNINIIIRAPADAPAVSA